MYKKGDEIVVEQWGGSYRPAVFISYSKKAEGCCNIKYISKPYIITVPLHFVIPKDVYLSPLFEALREEE